MAPRKSPQQQLQDERDRLRVSAQYKNDNPDLEPDRQEQIDRNRSETVPIEAAAPSRRTSEKLDEEE